MANTPIKATFAHAFLKDLQAELQQRDFDTIFQRKNNRLVIKESVLRLVLIEQETNNLVKIIIKVLTDPKERSGYRTHNANYQIATKTVDIADPKFDSGELKTNILSVMDKINIAITEFEK